MQKEGTYLNPNTPSLRDARSMLTCQRVRNQVAWSVAKRGEETFTHVEDSSSVKQARCTECGDAIEKGTRRIALPRKTQDLGRPIKLPPYINKWYHDECFWKCHRVGKYRKPFYVTTSSF